MKTVISLFIFISMLFPFSLFAQLTYLGLGAKRGTKIELIENDIYAGTDNGLFKKSLVDDDTLWTPLGLQGKYITDFIIFNTDTILVSVRTSTIGEDTLCLFITYNNGTEWSNHQEGYGGKKCTALESYPNAPDTIYARANACVAKSIDGGNTWIEVYKEWTTGGTTGKDFIHDIDPNNPGIIWAGGEGGYLNPYLLKSTDYGNNWQFIIPDVEVDNIAWSMVIHPDDINKILVGLSNNIILSPDGGESWSSSYHDHDPYINFFDMEISPNSNELVYATGLKYGTTDNELFFFESYDFGDTWENVTFPSENIDYATYDLEIINDGSKDEMFFATNHGIYKFLNTLTNVDRIADQNDCFWTLFPNPMNDRTTLSFINLKKENYTLKIQDSNGNCVQTITNITTSQVIIKKDNLPKGLYIFQLCNEREVYVTGKLIIN